MSWNDFIQGYLVNNTDPNNGKTATNVCEHGAIVSASDGTVWASTPGFGFGQVDVEVEKEDGSGTEKVSVNEFESLNDTFNNSGKITKKGGLRIHGEKYLPVSFDAERNVLYLKKAGGGACVAKSGQAYVVGTYSSKLKSKNHNGTEEVQNPGLVNRATEDLQKYLVDNNL